MVVGGAGRIGSYVVEYLARSRGINRIIVADIDERMGKSVAGNAKIGAAFLGFYPKIEFRKIDLLNEEQTAQVIRDVKPKVLIMAAAFFSPWGELQTKALNIIRKRLKKLGLDKVKGFNWRTNPAHRTGTEIAVNHKLFKAIKASGVDLRVISIIGPDPTHAVMAKIGLAPNNPEVPSWLLGAGTIDSTVQGVKDAVAKRLSVPMHNINVTMVHYHSLRVCPTGFGVPYYLKIRLGGEDITSSFNLDEVVTEAAHNTASLGLVNNASLTASSAVKNCLAILNDSGILTHAPGVAGIPGGYPVRVDARGAEIVLPSDLTIQDVERINYGGWRVDGVERLEDDGTILFTEPTLRVIQEILQLNYDKLRVDQAKAYSRDMIAAYNRLITEEESKT